MAKKVLHSSSETHTRTVFKSISWRIIATLTTISIVFLFTKKLILSLGVGLVEVTLKILFYYLHERLWNKVAWGKKKHPLSSFSINKSLEPEDLEKIKKSLKDLGYLD